MVAIRKVSVSTGVFWVEIPTADVRILCGCPVDSVKHMMRRGLIVPIEIAGVNCQTGPNAILLSDLPIQNGNVCSRSEFPVLQMLYRQGMMLPKHPGNTGAKPIIIGSHSQVTAQMDYIFRGNYGLATKEELIAAEVEPTLADEMMEMKRVFAFGHIRQSDELVQPLFVEAQPLEITRGVFIKRLRTNEFAISYKGETVEVDLNLAVGENYECPYSLDMHLLEREYFSIIHTGDGDGWDMNRPTIGSIVQFQGRIYLIDAGPNIDYTLTALGIGVNEIDGIFHTHGHDDHLAGLTVLMKRDKRIPYYAVPMVRHSVMKKMAAVMQLPESEFAHLFDFRDLKLDEWNNIEGLEVKPIFSPHPVETTIFYFRAMWEGGYKSYAHLADIASFEVLEKMLAKNGVAGISAALLEKTKTAYLQPATVKKIDIGGGMIHGTAADFREDKSDKLILAHTARKLSLDERTIGSGAPFGTTDVLIKGVSETLRNRAFGYLSNYFPGAPTHMIRHLMNGNVIVFNPESLLLKQYQPVDCVYLVLSGLVEAICQDAKSGYTLAAGSLIGEAQALLGTESIESYRAVSFVQVLRFSKDVYYDFIERNNILADILKSREKMEFLRGTPLFTDTVSCVTLTRLVNTIEMVDFEQDQVISPPANELLLIRSGSARLTTPDGYEERLQEGSHVAGAHVLSGTPPTGAQIRFLKRTRTYRLPLSYLVDFPIVHWKLIETHRRRYLEA
jgi:hemerythrin